MTKICSGRFADRIVAITGGGSGIGEAICRRVAAEGGTVCVLDVDAANAARVAEQIAADGGSAKAYTADVTNIASVAVVFERLVSDHGRLDAAVNNAGVGGPIVPIVDYPLDWWDRLLAVNVSGVFYCMRAQIPPMIAQGRGAIVNIASINSVVGHDGLAGYVASKHAVLGLTKSVALEYGRQGIRVNAVGPTLVRTPLASVGIHTDEAWAELASRHPTGRYLQPDEVAALTSYLISDDASSITGSLHLIDGGVTAS